MTNTICLDEKYSTTRMVIKEDPAVIANEMKQSSSPEDKFESVLFLPMGENRKGEGGQRTKGYFKKSYDDKPLISIITVVYNGEKYLEETIQSVINQTYDNVEYIIIDGGSTDRTLDIIKKYEDKIDYWVSERDGGIYDAMNKGIRISIGTLVGIISSDDWYELDACELMSNIIKLQSDACIIHGSMKIYGDDNLVSYSNKSIENYKLLKKGMILNHPATFVYLSLYKKHGVYSTNYKIASDWDFMLRCYINNVKFVSIDSFLANFRLGGTSYTVDKFSSKEKHVIRLSNNIVKYFDKYYYFDILKIVVFGKYLSSVSVLKQKILNFIK